MRSLAGLLRLREDALVIAFTPTTGLIADGLIRLY